MVMVLLSASVEKICVSWIKKKKLYRIGLTILIDLRAICLMAGQK